MIVMTERLQELMDELKVTNAETFYHSIHVKSLVMKMIKYTNELSFTQYSPREIDHICKGAILHDVGKLFVKNVILTKESALSEEEHSDIRKHTQLGFEAVKDELDREEYEIIRNICLYHHERVDGKGYEGKTDLPLYVQIVSACDVFDALHSDRIYREGIPYEETIGIIESGEAGCFDTRIVECLKHVTANLVE